MVWEDAGAFVGGVGLLDWIEVLEDDPAVVEAPVHTCGERDLYRAILEDAVHCAEGRSSNCGNHTPDQYQAAKRRAQADALAWIAGDLADVPVPFITCCHQLGLDPDWLRARLLGRLGKVAA